MTVDPIDQVQLSFDESTLLLLNVLIGLIMFGVALDIRVDDFKRVVRDPRGPLIGLGAQFLLLPAVTFLLVSAVDAPASVVLGMILVAACPGGNFSNFLAAYSRSNAALSVSMTAISTALAIVMTPFNLSFWGSRNAGTRAILEEVALKPLDLLMTILLILGIPLLAGMWLARSRPALATRLRRPMRIFSLVAFGLFVIGALVANWQAFLDHIGAIALLVAVHNGFALAAGYWTARSLRTPVYDSRAISIEVGIQNSALALVLIFGFFEGLGGMAIIAAWWGVWHLISGLAISTWWSRRPVRVPQAA